MEWRVRAMHDLPDDQAAELDAKAKELEDIAIAEGGSTMVGSGKLRPKSRC